MPDIHVSVDINRPPEVVFNRLADIAHYRDWLPPSQTYVGTTDISDMPIKQGTTYIDTSTTGSMNGHVDEYEPFARIVFHQIGKNPNIEIVAAYQLTPIPQGTRIERTTHLVLSGIYKLIQPIAVSRTRAENQRTLNVLKTFLESH